MTTLQSCLWVWNPSWDYPNPLFDFFFSSIYINGYCIHHLNINFVLLNFSLFCFLIQSYIVARAAECNDQRMTGLVLLQEQLPFPYNFVFNKSYFFVLKFLLHFIYHYLKVSGKQSPRHFFKQWNQKKSFNCWVKIWMPVKNQLPGYPRSGRKAIHVK